MHPLCGTFRASNSESRSGKIFDFLSHVPASLPAGQNVSIVREFDFSTVLMDFRHAFWKAWDSPCLVLQDALPIGVNTASNSFSILVAIGLLIGCSHHHRDAAFIPPEGATKLEITEKIESAAKFALEESCQSHEIAKIRSASSVKTDNSFRYLIEFETKGGSIWRVSLDENGESNYEVNRLQEIAQRSSIFKPQAFAAPIE